MMKRSIRFGASLAALFLMFGFAACSSATEENREYGDVDIDGDAVLDDNEFAAVWDETGFYDRWDIDQDGYIDDQEWTDVPSQYRGDVNTGLQEWDSDADQRLSEDEFRTGVYGYVDRDRDRMINEEEYNSWYRADE